MYSGPWGRGGRKGGSFERNVSGVRQRVLLYVAHCQRRRTVPQFIIQCRTLSFQDLLVDQLQTPIGNKHRLNGYDTPDTVVVSSSRAVLCNFSIHTVEPELWASKLFFKVRKSQIRKFLSSFRYRKSAKLLGRPVRKSAKLLWLIRNLQIRKFLPKTHNSVAKQF